jgi:hypothetical protein
MQTSGSTIVDLISHVPSPNSGPGFHVLAGTSLVGGLSIGLATVLSDIAVPFSDFTPAVVSTASLLIGLTFSSVSLWTLWQARRLDFQAGYKIHDFHDLIARINRDLTALFESLQGVYQLRAQPYHRVYLVTTQPFLGMLSYPNSTETREFQEHFRTLARLTADTIRLHKRGDSSHDLDFQVICGDPLAIKEFHRSFYHQSARTPEELAALDDSVEREIQQMSDVIMAAGGTGPFLRTRDVPRVQFMIIGNKLYEFTLDPGNSVTEIFNTQVLHDSRYCEAYIQNFSIMKKAVRMDSLVLTSGGLL